MRVLPVIALAVLFALPVSRVSAQYSIKWTNATGDSLWSDPGNWDLHRVPTGNDTVYFGDTGLWGSGLVDLGGAIQDARWVDLQTTTSSRGYTFTDGTLRTLLGITGTQSNVEIAANVAYLDTTALHTFAVDLYSRSSPIVVSGVIGGNGGASTDDFDFFGGAVLTNVNTYSGETTVLGNDLTLTGPLGSISQSPIIHVQDNFALHLDNTHGNNTNRLSPTAHLIFYTGKLVLDGNGTTASLNSLGPVYILSGN